MRWRTVAVSAAAVALLLGFAAVVLAAPVVWLAIDESAVPSASDLPTLPEGVTAQYQGVECGSGGCWREWTLSGTSPTRGDELVGSLDVLADGCAARSLVDRREVCTSVQDVGGETLLYLQFSRPWD